MKAWNKAILYPVIKGALLVLLFVFIIALSSRGKISNADFETVSKAVVEASTDMASMQETDAQMVKRLYGLNPSDYEGLMLYYPTTNMGAEEIFLVKLKDISQSEAVEKAIEARKASQMASFDGYGLTQYAMLENSKIELHGNYILYIVSPNDQPVIKAFEDAL